MKKLHVNNEIPQTIIRFLYFPYQSDLVVNSFIFYYKKNEICYKDLWCHSQKFEKSMR
jgi:hypothetical protein